MTHLTFTAYLRRPSVDVLFRIHYIKQTSPLDLIKAALVKMMMFLPIPSSTICARSEAFVWLCCQPQTASRWLTPPDSARKHRSRRCVLEDRKNSTRPKGVVQHAGNRHKVVGFMSRLRRATTPGKVWPEIDRSSLVWPLENGIPRGKGRSIR